MSGLRDVLVNAAFRAGRKDIVIPKRLTLEKTIEIAESLGYDLQFKLEEKHDRLGNV